MKKLSVNAFDVLVVEILLAVDKWVQNPECISKVTICFRTGFKIRFVKERRCCTKIGDCATTTSIFQEYMPVENGETEGEDEKE